MNVAPLLLDQVRSWLDADAEHERALKKGAGGHQQNYDPRSGRYGSGRGGAWGAALASSPDYREASSTHYDSPEAPRLANEMATTIVAAAHAVEPAITADITAVAEQTGATMYGLDFRIKENTARIADKIMETSAEDGVTIAEAAGKVSDPVRYTFHHEPHDYVPAFNQAQTELVGRGYAMRTKNYWSPGDAYNGVNVAATSPGGVPVELQFHTPESQRIKDHVHLMYEEFRSTGTSTARRRQLWREMTDISDNQTFPPDWETIPGAKLQPPPPDETGTVAA